MKTIKHLSFAAVVLCGMAAGAQSTTNFTFNVNAAVPENTIFGLSEGTNLTVTGGNIQSVSVSLDISGGFNGDLYAYLDGPNGGYAVLLNRTGVSGGNMFGYADTGFNITLSDAAANSVHFYQSDSYSLNGSGQLEGTWQPDGEAINPDSPAADFTGAQTAMLSSFDDTDPNGTWTLFVADVGSGGEATLNSWSLSLTTAVVPEPSTLALLVAGVGMAGWRVRSSRRTK